VFTVISETPPFVLHTRISKNFSFFIFRNSNKKNGENVLKYYVIKNIKIIEKYSTVSFKDKISYGLQKPPKSTFCEKFNVLFSTTRLVIILLILKQFFTLIIFLKTKGDGVMV